MIPVLSHWDNYYVIIGSSAAALTGLQFVVIALVADSSFRGPTSLRTIGAYASPTVVHFCSVLLVSAILSAPWTSLRGVAWCIGVCAVAGLLYDIVVIRRALDQKEYRPELSDWIWHTLLPILGHIAGLFAAFALMANPTEALFTIGVASLLLLFIGIHNAWDTVTYLAITYRATNAPPEPKRESDQG